MYLKRVKTHKKNGQRTEILKIKFAFPSAKRCPRLVFV